MKIEEQITAGKRIFRKNLAPHFFDENAEDNYIVEIIEGIEEKRVNENNVESWSFDEEVVYTDCFCLLNYADYIKLNHKLSVARGWTLENATERYAPMVPKLAIHNNETVCVMPLIADVLEKQQNLLEGIEFVSAYTFFNEEVNLSVTGEIETDVIDWAMNHCQKKRVNIDNLVTYIASQDVSEYPPIPAEGEWCEAKIYSYNGNKAKCLQPHTRTHRTPEEEPALWLIIETVTEGYPEWVQPTGAHDAYQKGDKVTFNDNDYESVIDANVWSPAAYPVGWKQI